MKTTETAAREISCYLKELGMTPGAIARIVEEDLPFLTTWELDASQSESLLDAEAVMAFSFGFGPALVKHPPEQYHPSLYAPGKTNEALAEVICAMLDRRDKQSPPLYVFAQWEVAHALKSQRPKGYRLRIARPGKKYLGTKGVVEQFIKRGLGKFHRIVLVAHRHHAFRCQRIATEFFKAKKKNIDILIPELPDVYDVDSVQPWTTSFDDWVKYEVGNRFYNRFAGNM